MLFADEILSHFTRIKGQLYKCNICHKELKFIRSITRHFMNQHTQTDAVQCKICGKMLKNLHTLQTHIWNMHNKALKI